MICNVASGILDKFIYDRTAVSLQAAVRSFRVFGVYFSQRIYLYGLLLAVLGLLPDTLDMAA